MRNKRILFTQPYSYFLHFLALFSFTWQPRSRDRLVCLKHKKVGYLGVIKFQSNAVYRFILQCIPPHQSLLLYTAFSLCPSVCNTRSMLFHNWFNQTLLSSTAPPPQNKCLQVFTFIIIFYNVDWWEAFNFCTFKSNESLFETSLHALLYTWLAFWNFFWE